MAKSLLDARFDIAPCFCSPGFCRFGVKPPTDCIGKLTGTKVHKPCLNDKHRPGGTWHLDGKCLVCFPPKGA